MKYKVSDPLCLIHLGFVVLQVDKRKLNVEIETSINKMKLGYPSQFFTNVSGVVLSTDPPI